MKNTLFCARWFEHKFFPNSTLIWAQHLSECHIYSSTTIFSNSTLIWATHSIVDKISLSSTLIWVQHWFEPNIDLSTFIEVNNITGLQEKNSKNCFWIWFICLLVLISEMHSVFFDHVWFPNEKGIFLDIIIKF